MEDDNVDQPGFDRHAFCDVRGDRRGGFAGLFLDLFDGGVPVPSGAALVLLLGLLAGVLAGAGPASARDYGLVTMNFDLWCQEEAHLPAHRCDRRTAADEKAFEDFQQQLSPYEAQNLRGARQEQWLDRNFLENDPIDNPEMPTGFAK
jgi:hypothetical protein